MSEEVAYLFNEIFCQNNACFNLTERTGIDLNLQVDNQPFKVTFFCDKMEYNDS